MKKNKPPIDTGQAVKKALQVNEGKFSALFDRASDGFLIADASTRKFLYGNATICSMLGYTKEELVQLTVNDIHPSKDLPHALDVFEKRAKAEKTPAEDLPVLRKDGSIFYADISAAPDVIEGVPCILGIFRDVTERKLIEEAISKEKIFSEHIINSLAGVFYLFDDQGRFVRWNKKFSEVTGYSPEELLGMRPVDFFSEADKAYISSRVQTVFAEGEAFAEAPLLTKSGEHIPYFFTGRLTVLEGRRYLLGVGIDITDRKRAEKALQEKAYLLSESQRIAHIGSWSWHLTGPIKWSAETYRIYGVSPETFTPTIESLVNLLHPEDRPAMQQWLKACGAGQSPDDLEFRVILSDGSVRLLNGRGELAYDAENRPAYMAGTVQDITDRKRAEEEKDKLQAQLLQAQKMESVGRLAGGVAHDFNNMLGVILGHAELALQQVGPAEPHRDNLEEIRKAGQRAADLTRQLLAFARKQTVSPQVLKLNDIMTNMLSMLGRLIGEDVELAWLPGDDLWPVKMDPSQVDQILANLCVNARDAIAGVGKVAIETRNAFFDEGYCAGHTGCIPGEYVQLTVSDSGCGMEKDILENLFEPFFTTKGVGKGTGLGLSTVYGIVRQNLGFINVHSEPGAGTTFKIYLPRSLDTLEQVWEGGQSLKSAHGTETILLVEDEPALLNMSRDMLESFGYRVLAAGTPEEAIKLAGQYAEEIDLLVTDVVMPGMTGWDLSKRLLSLYPKLKRLFMSGYTSDIIADHGILEEGMAFLQKPFSSKNLSSKVREVLGKKE